MSKSGDSNIIPFPAAGKRGAALQLKVELLLMPFPVWRRLLVPAGATFWDLHVALQDVMGWQDCHLHQFTVDEPRTGRRLRFGIPDDSGFHGVHDVLTGWEHPVAAFLAVDGHPALYTYDFGDDWQHEVTLEAVHGDSGDRVLPVCLAGEGPCPPEDSGGPAMCGNLLPGDDWVAFAPEQVLFENPSVRWQRAFGRE
jgi:hypothetical protein